MSFKKNLIDTNTKFNPEDERIFCPTVSKSGVTGHGLLKKYYIPHLDLNICEYCEIEENGQKNNLHYYQSRNQSKHLIHELKNWRKEILTFQKINENFEKSNLMKLKENLDSSNKSLVNTSKSLNNCDVEIKKFKLIFDEKLISYIDFLEQIMQLKDILQDFKFDEKGNLNIIAIGNDKEKEAKFTWMSLLFSRLKLRNLDVENFGLTEETKNLLENFITLFVDLNIIATNFVENLCDNLLPQVADLEKKNIKINKDYYIQKMPTVKIYNINEKDKKSISNLEDRIGELEYIILKKDNDLDKNKSEMENLRKNFEEENQKIINETNKINKSLLNEVMLLNKINKEINLENEDLRKKLNEINNDNITMSENNQESNFLVTQLTKKLDEISDLNNKLKDDLNFSQNENKKYLLRIKELEENFISNKEKDEKLQSLNKLLNTERSNFADLNNKYDNLNLEKKDLLRKYNMFNEEILNLKFILNEKEKLVNLEKQENANKIFEYNLLIENLRNEINNQAKQNKEKLFEINSLNDLNKSLAKSLENNQHLIDNNIYSIDNYVKRNQDLTLLNSKFSEEASHLKNRIIELQQYITDEEKKNSKIFADFQEKIKTLTIKNEHFNSIIEEQQLKLNNLNDQISKLNFQRNLLNDENEKNKSYLEIKENHINQYIEMIRKSEDDKVKLKNRINELEEFLLEKENSQIKKELEVLKNENENLNNSLNKLKKKHEEINNQIDIVCASDDENNKLIEKLNKKVDEIYRENERHKNYIKILKEENEKLKIDFSSYKNNNIVINEEKDLRIKEYLLTLENQKNQILVLEKSIKEKDKNLDDLMQINFNLNKDKNNLEEVLSKFKGELNSERKKSMEFNEKLNFMEKENLKLKEKLKENEENYLKSKDNYEHNINNLTNGLEKLREENKKNKFNLEFNLRKNEDLQNAISDERLKNNKYVEDMNFRLNKLSQENSDFKIENLKLNNELGKINSLYDKDIENYQKENNKQLSEFKNSAALLEIRLKELAEKNRNLNLSLYNLTSENEDNKRKLKDITILEENLYRKKLQEANNNIIIDNLNKEIDMLKNDNESLRRQIDENDKLSRSLRSSIFRSSNNSAFSIQDNNNNNNDNDNFILTTTNNVIDSNTKNKK
jgi:chromosome segregation ATPase